MNLLPYAGIWCVALLGAQLVRARGFGRKTPFAPAAGSAAAGVRYAFTGAMAPGAKESVRMNPGSYLAGLTYHAGVAAAFALLFLKHRALGALALTGALAGVALLAKRILKPHLRGLSSADDFVSNGLATGFAALAGLAAFLPAAGVLASGWCVALLLYLPLGKIRHCVFFFLSRYHLGAFFGRRGTFPPSGAGASHV